MFVMFLANKPLIWLGILALASLVTALMLIMLKPNVEEES
jgi:hypothetical protein